MSQPTELTLAERDLAGARLSFNVKRNDLQNLLERLNARDAYIDHLIYAAEQYGVNHAIETLVKTPGEFNIKRNLMQGEIISIKTQLQKTHDANHSVDAAMAKRENVLAKINPRHRKAINFYGQDVLIDSARNVLMFRDTRKEQKITLDRIKTDDAEQSQDNDRTR